MRTRTTLARYPRSCGGYKAIVLAVLVVAMGGAHARSEFLPRYQEFWGERTIGDVMDLYAPDAVRRMKPFFDLAGVSYPPSQVVLLATKRERQLELWARDFAEYRHIRTYRIRGLSGDPGPKLVEGDRQVPEGIYDISALNPNSQFHLSLKLNYPNHFDLYHARVEGRSRPGSNIFIHGKVVSKGCLAMGDWAIEELFVLTRHAGPGQVKVVIAPHDPRRQPLTARAESPPWAEDLYEAITVEFARFAAPLSHATH